MTHNFIDISPTLICNRRTIRVHEDVACEISLLSGKSSSLWISSSPVQPLQAHLESMEEKARSSSSAISCWIVANSFVAGADIERPYTTLPRSFAPGVGLPVSPRYALFCVPPQICEAARTAGSSDRWSLLSLQPTSVGAVFDGSETLPSKPRCFPGPFAFSRSGGNQLLVANHQHHCSRSAKAHTSVGVRPNSGHHLAGHRERLGLAAVSFSSHQPVARQPGKAKKKSRRQKYA